MIKKNSFRLIECALFSVFCIASVTYLNFFHQSLLMKDVENVNGFTRFVIPDTILYAELLDLDNPIDSLLSSGVKNSIGPGFLWAAAGKSWYCMLAINLAITFFIISFFKKICLDVFLTKRLVQTGVLVLLCSPFMIYYQIGALKELPMMLFMLIIVHEWMTRKWSLFFLAVLFLILFRYQMSIVLILTLFFMCFKKNGFRVCLAVLGLAACLYPALSSISVLSIDATQYYRESNGFQGSFGGWVESVRVDFYGLSLFAVIFRVFQTLFEPIILITGRMSFFEGMSFSVYDFIQFVTAVFYIFFVFRMLLNGLILLRYPKYVSDEIVFLYVFIFTSLFLICGFSFIHHRYSFPFFPLMLIASSFNIKSNLRYSS